jgi:hypothetical protein
MAHARLRGDDSVRPEAVADDDGDCREGWRKAQIKGREGLTSKRGNTSRKMGKKMSQG